jgi:hypothetical protein
MFISTRFFHMRHNQAPQNKWRKQPGINSHGALARNSATNYNYMTTKIPTKLTEHKTKCKGHPKTRYQGERLRTILRHLNK